MRVAAVHYLALHRSFNTSYVAFPFLPDPRRQIVDSVVCGGGGGGGGGGGPRGVVGAQTVTIMTSYVRFNTIMCHYA